MKQLYIQLAKARHFTWSKKYTYMELCGILHIFNFICLHEAIRKEERGRF